MFTGNVWLASGRAGLCTTFGSAVTLLVVLSLLEPTRAGQPYGTSSQCDTGSPTSSGGSPVCSLPTSDNTCSFLFFASPATWCDAKAFCESKQGQLARVMNADDNNAVMSGCQQLGADCWIGLNDMASPGNFAWTDNSSPSFTDWSAYNPEMTQQPSLDCVLATPQGWQNANCQDPHAYVCRVYGSTSLPSCSVMSAQGPGGLPLLGPPSPGPGGSPSTGPPSTGSGESPSPAPPPPPPRLSESDIVSIACALGVGIPTLLVALLAWCCPVQPGTGLSKLLCGASKEARTFSMRRDAVGPVVKYGPGYSHGPGFC